MWSCIYWEDSGRTKHIADMVGRLLGNKGKTQLLLSTVPRRGKRVAGIQILIPSIISAMIRFAIVDAILLVKIKKPFPLTGRHQSAATENRDKHFKVLQKTDEPVWHHQGTTMPLSAHVGRYLEEKGSITASFITPVKGHGFAIVRKGLLVSCLAARSLSTDLSIDNIMHTHTHTLMGIFPATASYSSLYP